MNLNRVKIIGDLLILSGITFLLISFMLDVVKPSLTPIAVVIGALLAVSGFVFFLFFWKCPSCRKHLPFSGMLGMEYCPYCGKNL